MERDDNKPTARFQDSLRRKQAMAEFFQFLIDKNPQALKDARSGMNTLARLSPDSLFNQICPLKGAPECFTLACIDNGPRNPAGLFFFTQNADDPGQSRLVGVVYHIGGTHT